MNSSRLDRSSELPLWAQLEAELRRALDDGDFDDRFPTDLELTRRAEQSGRILQVPGDFVNLPAAEFGWLERLGARLVVPVNDSRRVPTRE